MNERETEIPSLRTSGTEPGQLGASPYGINESVELVVDLLSATKLVPEDRLALARGRAQQTGSLGAALVEEGVASGDGIARMLALRHQMPHVDLATLFRMVDGEKKTGIDLEAVKLFPLHVLERVTAVPYAFADDGRVCVAIADPADLHSIDELRLATRHPLELAVASRDDISVELHKLSRASGASGAKLAVEELDAAELDFAAEEDETDLEAVDGISDAPLVRLVNSVLFQAAEDGASDVHFAPEAEALVVRYRIDGVLQEVQRIPKRMAAGVTTRLKVLAKLDIAERRKPQDGRISLNAAAAGRMLDIRVATLPTVEGESVVMRLLDKSRKPPTLEELGLSEEMRDTLTTIVTRPTGALLVTGPTGSGKSTTLFAALNQIANPSINIITVEDPVEYRLPGINQVQINARAGLTFAAALRSILRSDPDVVMVGEIRDGETAKISIEAALTGHLVLSTLHTNDAPSALTRLNEMGVEPFLTGAAVTGVLAQRLARKLCAHCCEMYTPTRDELLDARALTRRSTGWPSTGRRAARAATRPATRAGSASTSCSR